MLRQKLFVYCSILAFLAQMLGVNAMAASADVQAPVIVHTPSEAPVKEGQGFVLSATVSDDNSVKEVQLFYRTIGQKEYSRIEMRALAKSNEYSATIPGWKLLKPGIEYFIQAEDQAGNSVLYGFSFSPVAVAVASTSPLQSENTIPKKESSAFASNAGAKSTKKSGKKWLWIGLGAAVVAGLASSGGGGSSSSGPTTTDIDVVAPIPQ